MDYGAGRVARALLSDRYRRIDNMEIASAVLPLFAGSDQYEVVSPEVTENRLYLKIVNRRLEMAVVPGDIVQAGVMISNSEVGLGSVSVQPLVYRLVCTNGMVVNDMGERKNHVGRAAKAVDDSFHIYSDETLEAEDKAFLLKLRDVTLAAIEESRFAQVVGRLKEAAGIPITGKVTEVVELTAKTYGFNSDEQEQHPAASDRRRRSQPIWTLQCHYKGEPGCGELMTAPPPWKGLAGRWRPCPRHSGRS